MPFTYSLASAKESMQQIMVDQINASLNQMVYSLGTQCQLSFPKNDITSEVLNDELLGYLTSYGFFTELTSDSDYHYLKVSLLAL